MSPCPSLLTALARLWVALATLLAGVPAGGVQLSVLAGEHLHVVLQVAGDREGCECPPCDAPGDAHGDASPCADACGDTDASLLFGSTCRVLGPHHGHEHEALLDLDLDWDERVEPGGDRVAPLAPPALLGPAPTGRFVLDRAPAAARGSAPTRGDPAPLERRRRLVRSVVLRV